MGKEKIIPPADMETAEKMLLPDQLAMSKAREEVLSHKQAFKDVGIDEEQILAAAERAGELALAKYEQREKEDPINFLKNILNEIVQTEQEKQIADHLIRSMDSLKERWRKEIKTIRDRFGSQFDIRHVVRLASNNVDVKQQSAGGIEKFPVVNFISAVRVKDEASGEEQILGPSRDFLERGLKAAGVFKEMNEQGIQGINDLQDLPRHRKLEEITPVFVKDRAEVHFLPTMIPGMYFHIFLRHNYIEALMAPDLLEKI
jgi:hypothetical protein